MNQGEAIPEDKREKIFTKFYQADESHASEGNGIGLALVSKVVELHGGRVIVSCKDGVAAFTVSLPKWRYKAILSQNKFTKRQAALFLQSATIVLFQFIFRN